MATLTGVVLGGFVGIILVLYEIVKELREFRTGEFTLVSMRMSSIRDIKDELYAIKLELRSNIKG